MTKPINNIRDHILMVEQLKAQKPKLKRKQKKQVK